MVEDSTKKLDPDFSTSKTLGYDKKCQAILANNSDEILLSFSIKVCVENYGRLICLMIHGHYLSYIMFPLTSIFPIYSG